MVSHVALGPEALAAPLWALEGPLVGMDSHVDPQILLLTEGLTAARVCTLIRLGPIVEVEMSIEAELAREGFVAPSLRADVPCSLLVAFRGSREVVSAAWLLSPLTDVTEFVQELASCGGSGFGVPPPEYAGLCGGLSTFRTVLMFLNGLMLGIGARLAARGQVRWSKAALGQALGVCLWIF